MDDALAPHSIDHEIPCRREQEGSRGQGARAPGGLVDADIDLLPDVLEVRAFRPYASQVTHERGLVSHDFTDKPLLECVLHEASIYARSSAEIS